MSRAPTVNDLRVKLCYICREEEQYDAIVDTPKRWVHPCKCSLIAHEECLLHWIRAGEENPEKPLSNILKCPQCGANYGLESNSPTILKIMDKVNDAISMGANGATILAVGSIATSIGAGVYILLTSYGAFAIQKFVGEEMYKLILADDPSHWPLHAYINLPMIPLSLVFSNTKRFRDTLPLLPLLLFWPSIPPFSSATRSSGLLSSLSIGKFTRTTAAVQSPSEVELDALKDLLFSWPPSPAIFCLGVPYIRSYYRLCMKKLRDYVLDGDSGEDGNRRGGQRNAFGQNWRMEMHIEDDIVQVEGIIPDHEAQPAVGINDAPVAPQDDINVELVLEGGEAAGREEQPENPVAEVPHAEAPAPAPAPALAPVVAAAAPQNVNNEAGQAARGEQPAERQRDPVRLRVSGGTLGKLIGGALLTPTISSLMGSLLLRLALPSGSNAHKLVNFTYSGNPQGLLRRFLAIKPPGSAPLIPAFQMYKIPANADFWTTVRYSFALTARLVFVGSPAWCGADPVWWRNAVGLGIWTVARDLISLSYEYLTKQEIDSRHLKDRPFTDMDPKELDLRPDFH